MRSTLLGAFGAVFIALPNAPVRAQAGVTSVLHAATRGLALIDSAIAAERRNGEVARDDSLMFTINDHPADAVFTPPTTGFVEPSPLRSHTTTMTPAADYVRTSRRAQRS